MVIQWIREKQKPVGLFVADIDDDGCLRFGWCRCSKKEAFNEEQGINLATQRMQMITVIEINGQPLTLYALNTLVLPISLCMSAVEFIEYSMCYYSKSHVNNVMFVSVTNFEFLQVFLARLAEKVQTRTANISQFCKQ